MEIGVGVTYHMRPFQPLFVLQSPGVYTQSQNLLVEMYAWQEIGKRLGKAGKTLNYGEGAGLSRVRIITFVRWVFESSL